MRMSKFYVAPCRGQQPGIHQPFFPGGDVSPGTHAPKMSATSVHLCLEQQRSLSRARVILRGVSGCLPLHCGKTFVARAARVSAMGPVELVECGFNSMFG